MSVDNYTTVAKMDVDELISNALKNDYITSAPIEHYAMTELIRIAEMAKKNDLMVSIREERSNFYQGVLLGVIKRKCINEMFLSHL
jgi:hypothetical protein